MFLYQIVTLFIITSVFSIYNVYALKQKKFNTIILYLLSFLLILIIGFRDSNIDSDFWSYVTIFEGAPDIIAYFDGDFINNSAIEPGYLFINSLIKLVTADYRGVFVVFAIIYVGIYIQVLKKTEYMIVAFLVLLSNQLTTEMAQLRQGIVCALLMFSIYPLSEGKVKKYFFILLIASLFHYTALLGIILYLMRNVKWNFYKTTIISIFCLIILQADWIEKFMGILPSEWSLAMRLLKYANSSEAIEGNRGLGDFKLIFLLGIFSYMRKYVSDNCAKYADILISMFVIGMIIRFSFHEYIVFSGRLSEPFFSSLCMLIPFAFKIQLNKYVLLFLIILYLGFSFIKSLYVESLYVF